MKGMSSLSSDTLMSVWKVIKGDRLFLLCLLFSITLVFFQWNEIFFAIPVLFLLFAKKQSSKCIRMTLVLLVFSVFYLIGHLLNAGIDSRSLFLIYLFPPIYYMAGSYLGAKYKMNEHVLVFVLFSFVLMYAAYDFSRIVFSVFTETGEVIKNRMILDESGESTRGATGYAIIMSVLMPGIALLFSPKQKGLYTWIRWIGVAVAFLALYGMMTIVTRTSVMEAFIMLAFSIYMFLSRNKKRRGSIGFLLGAIVLVGLFYYVSANSSFLQISDAYSARNDESGYEVSQAGGRLKLWLLGIQELILSPFGRQTGRLSNGAYCHNMWLDVGINAGWIPFFILIVITLKNVRDSYLLYKDERYEYFTRLYLTAMFISVTLGCFVEPVLDNVYRHFLVYVFFCGLVSEMTHKQSGRQSHKSV